jgi:hypothetical protein
MSYSSHRREALNPETPVAHRRSHARSCARLVSQKFSIHRGIDLARVSTLTGVDLLTEATEEQVDRAMSCLEALRQNWDDPR